MCVHKPVSLYVACLCYEVAWQKVLTWDKNMLAFQALTPIFHAFLSAANNFMASCGSTTEA